ncbi:hypothetical protein NQ317_003295 [Molorchus minor]|uniref:Uncharacterized protein n=1 Tax=Molorchus minor TaxID=1323400 RepID=A0ABQ9J5P9_9CUCU|nr:hypothetical protein NQ317_003295 [Molorchus minor]
MKTTLCDQKHSVYHIVNSCIKYVVSCKICKMSVTTLRDKSEDMNTKKIYGPTGKDVDRHQSVKESYTDRKSFDLQKSKVVFNIHIYIYRYRCIKETVMDDNSSHKPMAELYGPGFRAHII